MVRAKTYSLPARVKALVVQDVFGDYDIIINSDLSHAEQIEAYKHELEHIKDNDFERLDADQIELNK